MQKDVIVIGAGAAGMMAAISAAKSGCSVLLLEKLAKIGAKLKATGGGRCNLTNTLSQDEFITKFGKEGRFMQDALNSFNNYDLIDFFKSIGVETDAPDGFRVFPKGHKSTTIIEALNQELNRLQVEILTSARVLDIKKIDNKSFSVAIKNQELKANRVIIATGGKGYPTLGAQGDGYTIAKNLGHKVTKLYPAMMPLKVKESWVANCRADTVAKVFMQVDLKKYKKYSATGDLIFTKDGIRGPVVLDFSREITPLLDKLGEVPIVVNLTKGMNFEDILLDFKSAVATGRYKTTQELVQRLLPESIAKELIKIAKADGNIPFGKQKGAIRDNLIKLLAKTPLTVTGHSGFDMAMITRGGVSLKDINPKTLESKLLNGLHFCGEVVNLDGPCGGYNLQWAFSSGYLAGFSCCGKIKKKNANKTSFT